MLWTRWIIYGLPLALGAVVVWSAGQARTARVVKGQSELVVASGEPVRPTLNPCRAQTDAARELMGLLHEPLLRVDAQGNLARGLAERWSWSQTVSFWFAQEKYALQAADKLSKLDATQRARWHLTLADVVGNELRLYFSAPHPQTGARVMESLAEFGPLPVETVRVELEEPAQGHHQFFMQNAVEREQIKDVWFDGPNAYELQVSGEALRLFEELSLYYQNQPQLRAKVRLVGKRPLLTQSRLELQIREGATFHDGTPVTSADVVRTLRLVADSTFPVPGRDALRRVHSMESQDARSLRMTFREPYGALPAALVDLPVLPAPWIERHGRDALKDETYDLDPPPGTGKYRLAEVEDHRLLLARVDAAAGERGRHVQFVFGRTPGNIRAGFAMKAVDAFWPAPSSLATLERDGRVSVQSGPIRSQLLVLWNCRRAPLNDTAVREALGLMVDREALMESASGGAGVVQDGIYRPGMWYARPRPATPPDPARARQMLYERGWTTDGQEHFVKGTGRLRIELLTAAGNPERLDVARRLAEAWEEQGVEVVVTEVAWEDLLGTRLPGHEFDAVLLGLDHEVSWDQSPFWHSTQAARGLNYTGISNPALDGALDALRVETDLGRIQALAEQVEARVADLHPFLPLFSSARHLAVRKEALSGVAGEALDGSLGTLLEATGGHDGGNQGEGTR